MAWKPITPDRYDNTLNWIMPQRMEQWGFLGGEAVDTDPKARSARYTACIEIDGKHYEAGEPMTAGEFDQLTPAVVIDQLSVAESTTT
jgi:hypothetical protein